MDTKLDSNSQKLVRQQSSFSARFDNNFKCGGNVGTPLAFRPIVNSEYKFPVKVGLNALTSLKQMNSMNEK